MNHLKLWIAVRDSIRNFFDLLGQLDLDPNPDLPPSAQGKVSLSKATVVLALVDLQMRFVSNPTSDELLFSFHLAHLFVRQEILNGVPSGTAMHTSTTLAYIAAMENLLEIAEVYIKKAIEAG